jgi:hypothetical protein
MRVTAHTLPGPVQNPTLESCRCSVSAKPRVGTSINHNYFSNNTWTRSRGLDTRKSLPMDETARPYRWQPGRRNARE